MSSYDDYLIDSAAGKVKRYGEKLNDNEYYAVIKRASVSGQYGKLARDILATAKEQNWEALSYVSSYCRDKYKEETLASMGTSLVNAGGCFITTACLHQFKNNFDDDCYELTELRFLRDTFVKIQHPEDVEEYYRIGPIIVDAINSQPQYEKVFSNRSFAFRPGRSTLDAIKYLKNKMNSGYDCVIKTDIKSCYDTINHDVLISILKRDIPDSRICILLERLIRAKYCKYNRVIRMTLGIMQGSTLSPLLANIYLNEFDQKMEKQGFQFIRYADDIIFLGRNNKEVSRAFVAAKKILKNELHLMFNGDKTVKSLRRGIDFLGYHIGRRSRYGYYKLFVGEEAKDNLMKYALIARKAECDTPENHLKWIGSFNRGWLNYFKYADKRELKKLSRLVDEKQRKFFIFRWAKQSDFTLLRLTQLMHITGGFVTMKNWLGELIGRISLQRKGE